MNEAWFADFDGANENNGTVFRYNHEPKSCAENQKESTKGVHFQRARSAEHQGMRKARIVEACRTLLSTTHPLDIRIRSGIVDWHSTKWHLQVFCHTIYFFTFIYV